MKKGSTNPYTLTTCVENELNLFLPKIHQLKVQNIIPSMQKERVKWRKGLCNWRKGQDFSQKTVQRVITWMEKGDIEAPMFLFIEYTQDP